MSNASRAKAIAPLDAHVGYWLRAVSNHVSAAFQAKLEAHGVTVAEWVALRTLYDLDSAKPSALARTLGVTRGAMSKIADRLLAKGLVRVGEEVADRRAQPLLLTAAGRRLVPALAAVADANDAAAFDALKPADRDHLLATLRRLAAHLGLDHPPLA